MQTRFGRGPYDDPMENLSNLKQDGLLEDYKNQFDILALKVQKPPRSSQTELLHGRVEGGYPLTRKDVPSQEFGGSLFACPNPGGMRAQLCYEY
jgi:hypothetical protein